MNLGLVIYRSLTHFWRTNVAVALAVAVATAVLTGALLVGDSMRGSLLRLAMGRMARVTNVLVADHFFRQAIVDDYVKEVKDVGEVAPAILAPGSMERPATGGAPLRRAGGVSLFGCDQRISVLADGAFAEAPKKGEVVLNETLAQELGVAVGDSVIARIARSSDIPADSALGRKSDTTRSMRLEVVAIAPSGGFGDFSLHASQQKPRNAFAALETLQDALDQPGKINVAFSDRYLSLHEPMLGQPPFPVITPQLEDTGVTIKHSDRGYDYLASDRMLLSPQFVSLAKKELADYHPQPVLTYLANYIEAGDDRAKIPYSTVAALDLTTEPPLGPFLDRDGKSIDAIGDGEIVLNRWAADDLAKQGVTVNPGDEIRLTYFKPESLHGRVEEDTAPFKLKAIVEMKGAAVDPDLTPELKGVTDQKSIADWDPPFEFHADRVRSRPPHDEDDAYWREYKATPKAFVSLATGHRLWASRFGDTTSIRFVPPSNVSMESLATRLMLSPRKAGFEVIDLRDQLSLASQGTTPFSVLFLAFSFFIIAAVLMLLAILCRLGLDQRATQLGLWMAVGLNRRHAMKILVSEGLFVATVGAAFGVLLGAGYAWLLIEGLKSPRFWLSAIGTPFLSLEVPPATLAIGFASGLIVTLLTILFTVWRMTRLSPRKLLSGLTSEPTSLTRRSAARRYGWAAMFAIAAIGLAILAGSLGGASGAGAFFGAGGLALGAALAAVSAWLRAAPERSFVAPRGWPLARLAARNTARNASRSTLIMGLVAVATFLIVAVSAFEIDPTTLSTGKASGSGGFTLMARSDQPIYQDLNSEAGLEALGVSKADRQELAGCQIFQLRLKSRDDASCLNLYQPNEPTVVGASQALIDRGGFTWVASLAKTDAERQNPWLVLDRPEWVAVMDEATALYSLHIGDGIRSPVGAIMKNPIALVGGLLSTSVFQGDVVVSEKKFLHFYPDIGGYRLFLIDAPPERAAAVSAVLERALGDFGFDVSTTEERLRELSAVQNTYLSTFQSLGALGLMLGTLGLAAVELRSVVERRGELALLRAIGFRRRRLAAMVLLENAVLLIGGLGIGVVAALIAVAPRLATRFGGAVPWASLGVTLAAVLLVGFIAGLIAVRATLRADLMPALRSE